MARRKYIGFPSEIIPINQLPKLPRCIKPLVFTKRFYIFSVASVVLTVMFRSLCSVVRLSRKRPWVWSWNPWHTQSCYSFCVAGKIEQKYNLLYYIILLYYSFLTLTWRYVLLTVERDTHWSGRERSISCLWYTPRLGNQTRKLGMFPDQGSNAQSFGEWDDAPNNRVTRPGWNTRILENASENQV